MVWLVACLFAGLTGCLGSLPLIGRDPAPKSTPPSARVQPTSEELPTAPQLRLETGMHTAAITHIGIDAGNRYLVTGSHDKTIRVWELATGRLLRTLRPPIGTGREGEVNAVALSPDGNTIAASGWTGLEPDGTVSIMLFDRASGRLLRRLNGLSDTVTHLVFSRNGELLVATLQGKGGIRVYRLQDGTEVARDTTYGGDSFGADFDATGRLVTTAWDGIVRLYDRDLRLRTKRKAPGGERPLTVAFAPDGSKVAVGYADSTRIDVLSGQDLSPQYAPDTSGVTNGNLGVVTWSADGQRLYAGGEYDVQGINPVRFWAAGGKGAATDLTGAQATIVHLLPITTGGVVFGASDPAFGVIDATGQRRLFQGPATADFRNLWTGFLVAPDAATVQFGYDPSGQSLVRFALMERTLMLQPAENRALAAPVTSAPGMDITGWQNTTTPKLNGVALQLDPYETSRSLAIAPDRQRFLMGTDQSLRLFDRQGVEQWRVPAPSIAWGVNIAGNGQVAVAAFGDGTIRWYRLRDGQPLLALFPHNDRKRWVLWTPSGYYDAAPGAEELIGWHVNRGYDQEADFFPVSQFRTTYFRPEVIAKALETLDESEALRQADASTPRRLEPVVLTERLPPVVQILSPEDGATVSEPQVTLRVNVRSPEGEPVTALKALIDGRPVPETRSLDIVQDNAAVRELQITVPPQDCEVTLIAENRHATSAPATIRLRWQGTQEEFTTKPKLYVLAVGISQYPDERLHLGFAAKDAQDFVDALQRQNGHLYREVEVKLLTDATATKGDILDGLDWLEKQTTQKDIAAIFLSGHGLNDRDGNYYFLPADVEPQRLKRTGVPFPEFKSTVASLPGKVLFFIDTCHSGNVMGTRRGATDITAVVNELTSTENGAVVFAASTGNQYSLEDVTWANGAFTKALVEGLHGKADYTGRGTITVNMLDLYLSERVKELTKGRQTPTTTKPYGVPDFPVAVVQ